MAQRGCELAEAVAAELGPRRARLVQSDSLALERLTVTSDRAAVDGDPIGAIWFHARSTSSFGGGLGTEEHAFANAETRAMWIAALHVPGVRAVNRFSASHWLDGALWAGWRSELASRGAALAPLALGACALDRTWITWSTAETLPVTTHAARILGSASVASPIARHVLVVDGRAIDDARVPAALTSALVEMGLRLVAIGLDASDRVITLDPFPTIPDSMVPAVAPAVTAMLVAS